MIVFMWIVRAHSGLNIRFIRTTAGSFFLPALPTGVGRFAVEVFLLRQDAYKFLMQSGIYAILVQQTFMCAALDNSSPIQNQNQIGFANRA
jgi:hypothetical protein